MQLKQLEYFIKIVECGSITKAANELFISQPNITKQIISLEHEYNIKLFERKARGIDLTIDGKKFLPYAKGVVSAAMTLENSFNTSESCVDRFFIATQQFDFIYRTLYKTYHDNQDRNTIFNLVETDRDEIIKHILRTDVDLGLLVRSYYDSRSFLWTTDKKRLDINVIDSAPIYACVGPNSPLYGKDTVPLEETNNYSRILLDMEQDAKNDINQELYFKSGGMSTKLFLSSTAACEYFLLRTDSLMFASKWTLGSFKSKDIRTIRIACPKNIVAPHTELVWVKRLGEPLNVIEEQFLQHLKDELKSYD